MKEDLEIGFYWVLLHPNIESDWVVGYYDYHFKGGEWYILGLNNRHTHEGEDSIIDEIGEKITPPPSKINYN